MKRSEENAKEWMEEQEASPRPGSSSQKIYIPKGVTLNPIVKMVKPESLKPNPKNDFDPLSEDEYASLKENIALNGILDALTARKDGTLVTGENRYRIALELKEHEDEVVRRRVENIPVRYYMNELTPEEEYDILEGDNLFRRHLTPEQKKERLKRRILRKYKDDLLQDNRGGDRKSESLKEEASFQEEKSNLQGEGLIEGSNQISKQESDILTENSSGEGNLFLETEGSKIHPEPLKQGSNEKSKYHPDILIGKQDVAKKVSENENIPLGTARRYVTELKKELKNKDPKPSKKKTEKKKETATKKDTVKEFQKKYSKMSASAKKTEVNRLVGKLIGIRKKRETLEAQVTTFLKEDSEIVAKLVAVGEKKRVQGLPV
ncbi:chromosome partitioning protein ParB [Leptospira interrogans]|uniref:chromosome partitioning protein ParB n=1 Tax=Leptospira interrogans TaxID=173 RepID=UPI001F07E5E7|nr:chromosome partitioning protein ParB [Leptospira interrogans]UML84270.1 chromosome partitioning protein ParB [Leptospira interrogans]UML84286.1 chromosome partitioning protein ParB [Leptospira interrogans]